MRRDAPGEQAVLAGQMRDILEALLSVNGAWDVVERSQVEQVLEWLDAVASGEDKPEAKRVREKAEAFGKRFPGLKTVLGYMGKEALATAVKRLVETILDDIPFCTRSAVRLWREWQHIALDNLSRGSGKPVASHKGRSRSVLACRRTTSRWWRTAGVSQASI